MHVISGPATCAAGAGVRTATRGRRCACSAAQQPPAVQAPRVRRRPALPDTGLSAHGCAALLGVAAAVLLVAADPAQAGEHSVQAGCSSHGGMLFQLGAEEPEFWTNMGRYARFAVGTGLGMFYTVARPLVDLLRKPTTAVPLVLGLVALTKLLSWTLNAMLGLDDAVQIVY